MPISAESIERVLLRELGTLRREIQAYPSDALVWDLPDGLPNSGGTLALHLAGNLQHYVGAVLGRSGYVRNRPREFGARGLSREELLAEVAAAETAIRATFPRLDESTLRDVYPEPIRDRWIETSDMLVQLAVHLAYHLGQVSYHRRLVTGDATGQGALDPTHLRTARPALEPPPPI